MARHGMAWRGVAWPGVAWQHRKKMRTSEPYLRVKKGKWIIERKLYDVDGKTKTQYIKTLPDMKVLLGLLGLDASQYYENREQENNTNASDKKWRHDVTHVIDFLTSL